MATTSDPFLNERIEKDAGTNQLVNVITNPEKGNVHFPSTIHRGKLNIAVSTGGASPKLAKKIRDEIAHKYGEIYETYLEFLYEVRRKVKELQLEKREQNRMLQEVLKPIYLQKRNRTRIIFTSIREKRVK